MLFINEMGKYFHVPNDYIPEENREWCFNKSFMFHDEVDLEECWAVEICKENIHERHNPYEYVGEKIFDHEPTKEEILWVMGKFDAVRFSYARVSKVLRYKEPDDED